MYAKPLIMSYIITYYRLHVDIEIKSSVSDMAFLLDTSTYFLLFNSPSLFHDDAADPLGRFP